MTEDELIDVASVTSINIQNHWNVMGGKPLTWNQRCDLMQLIIDFLKKAEKENSEV